MNAEEYLERAKKKLNEGDLEGAIVDCTEAITIGPPDAEVYWTRGFANLRKGNFDEAIADFSEAIRIGPPDAKFYCSRGSANLGKGDLDEAIADCTKAIEIDCKLAVAYAVRASAKQGKDDLEGAIADYSEALRIGPIDAQIYKGRGLAKLGKGDFDGAIADCTEAIEHNPDLTMIYSIRGIAKQKKGDFDGAIADFSDEIRINPHSAIAYVDRGDVKGLKGDLSGAVEDWKQANQLNGAMKNFHLNLWIVHEHEDGKKFNQKILHKLLELSNLVLMPRGEKSKKLAKPKDVMHYTNRCALRKIASGESFRLYAAGSMDDLSEGSLFVGYILDNVQDGVKDKVKKFITTGSRDTFIGSFTTSSDENNGDDTMWRCYGKHEDEAGAGCAFIFDKNIFSESIPHYSVSPYFDLFFLKLVDKNLQPPSSYPGVPVSSRECNLFEVVYENEIDMDTKDQIKEISRIVQEICADENADKCQKIVLTILDFIRFRFKGESFKDEKEIRMVLWRGGEKNVKTDYCRGEREYVECPSSIFPKKILLGPAVPSADNCVEWLNKQEAIRRNEVVIKKAKRPLKPDRDF